MNRELLQQIQAVAAKLLPLNIEFAFLGGAVLGLLITDPAAAAIRSTKDVDVLMATKLEGFKGRGESDWYGSQDLEDIITLVDGRPEMVAEIASSPVKLRRYLADEVTQLLAVQGFLDAMPGHLPPDSASQRRLPLVMERLKQIGDGK